MAVTITTSMGLKRSTKPATMMATPMSGQRFDVSQHVDSPFTPRNTTAARPLRSPNPDGMECWAIKILFNKTRNLSYINEL
jgi:hypothetical protein